MRPSGRPAELFDAFSRVTSRAFISDRLLACPTLSKAPNYGQVLRRFLINAPQHPPGPIALARIAARYVLSNTAHVAFLALSALYIRILGWKFPADLFRDPEKKLLIIDTFAVLPKIATDNAFHELYMPGLAEEAVLRGHAVARLFRLYGSRDPRILWRAFKVLARTPNGITEAHLLAPADWLRLLWHCLCYPFALIRLIRSLKRFPEGTPESRIREALIHTAGQCVALGEARRLAGLRLGLRLAARPFVRPGTRDLRSGPETRLESSLIVSWYENQTVNKCLQRGLSQAEAISGRHVRVLGAQLFLWPDTLLNNHPDDGEAALGLAPDRVLVNGPYFLPQGSRQEYAVGASLRYAGVFSPLKRPALRSDPAAAPAGEPGAKAPRPAQDVPLLALLSYHPEEVRRVLEMLLPLANSGAKIMYKFHPATQPEHFTAWLPLSPQLAQGSLQTSLQSIFYQKGAVLGSGSGALAEAAACGIPVLAVQNPVPGLGLDYLPEYGRGLLWEPVSTGEDVKKSLRTLAAAFHNPDREETLRVFREMLFCEPTPARIRQDFEI